MGNTCKSMADSCQCMTKPITILLIISLQLIKINEKKKQAHTSIWKLQMVRAALNEERQVTHLNQVLREVTGWRKTTMSPVLVFQVGR